MELLAEGGAVLSYSDPHIPALPSMRSFDVPSLEHQELTRDYLASQDCVLIATDHSAFDYQFIARHAPLIVDTRNAMADVTLNRDRIRKA
jgi:UDP-N-acetyl-D-glucosamine dehydrogenase